MKKLAIILSVLLVLTAVVWVTASGFKKYDISLNLEQGQVHKLRSSISMKMDQTMENEKMEVTTLADVLYCFEVEDVKDGEYTLALSYEDIEFEANVVVPTAENGISQKLDDSFTSAFKDIIVKIHVSKEGDVTGLEGFDQLTTDYIEKVSESGLDETQAQLNYNLLMGLLSEENLKTTWDSLFAYIPPKSVKVGESWESEYNMTQPYPVNLTITYTLKEVTKDVMVIEINSDIDMEEDLEQQGFTMKIKLGGKISGQVTVARSNGWLQSMDFTQELAGSISTEIPGYGPMEVPVTMSSLSKVVNE